MCALCKTPGGLLSSLLTAGTILGTGEADQCYSSVFGKQDIQGDHALPAQAGLQGGHPFSKFLYSPSGSLTCRPDTGAPWPVAGVLLSPDWILNDTKGIIQTS